MSYIKYQGDPTYSRVSTATSTLCSSTPVKPGLGLENGVFSVTGSSGTSSAGFSEFKTMAYPVDGYSMLTIELCQGETVELINNNLVGLTTLNTSKTYVKGIMMAVKYPATDETGAETNPADFSITLEYDTLNTAYELADSCAMPVGEYFMHFAPQAATDPRKLINTMYVTNPSNTFSVKLTVMLIKTKTDTNPNNCNC
jgi:hypothetical protein